MSALDQEAAQKGMQWVYDRLWMDKTFAPIDGSKRTWQPNSQQAGFAQGVLATFEDGLDKLLFVGQNIQGSEWNIAPIPSGPAKRDALITTDSWAIWRETKAKDAAWELLKFVAGKEFYEQQVKALAYIPSRKSQLETWVSTVKSKGPGFASVDYKVVTDALTGANNMNYLTVDEIFQCQKEAEDVLQPALNAVLAVGDKLPSYFRDVKAQLDQAAGGCGATYR